jgi:thiamine biosynthesis lipoprotein
MMLRAQPWHGAVVEITIADAVDNAGLRRAFDVIAAVHGLMGVHEPDSDVLRINRAAPGAVLDIDPRTAVVLSAALALALAR